MYLQIAISAAIYGIIYQITSSIFWCPVIGTILVGLLFAVARLGAKELWICARVFPREVSYLATIIKQVVKMKKKEKSTLGSLFRTTVQNHPNKTAIVDSETGKRITFLEFQELANKFSNIFHDAGFKKGDVIAICLQNRLEYLPLLLGLSELGVISALINTHLKGKSLSHALESSSAAAIVVDASLNLNDVVDTCSPNLKCFVLDAAVTESDFDNLYHLETLLTHASTAQPQMEVDLPVDFPVSYIFTSGTSGYPKAVIMPRKKYIAGFSIFEGLTYLEANDVVYNTLPMYHTSGSLIFFTGTFTKGCTMVLRKKFSVAHFFKDCIEYNVTYTGYVGELWRYLLAAPPSAMDKQHCIKRIVGNGLRRSLFQKVKERFNIPIIHEFYGATESNMGCINHDNTLGAVGFRFKCFPFLNMWSIVQVDRDTGTLVRGEDGLGIECKAGEPGTLVAKINKIQIYYGYTKKQESDKKVGRDVFKKGDSAYLTGDILVLDEYGYLYFVDRIGDTYRWKGENVSTTEVENIIAAAGGSTILDAIVYPVKVPYTEGACGMAYLQVADRDTFDMDSFCKTIQSDLPDYAIPVFLKVGSGVETTATHKYIKTNLKNQGFDPAHCLDDECLYMYDSKRGAYTLLSRELYANALNGKIL